MQTFFVLSGENPSLSAAELRQILRINNSDQLFAIPDNRLATASVSPEKAAEAVNRAAYTKAAALLVGLGPSVESITFLQGWEKTVKPFKSFDVSVVKLGAVEVNSFETEKKIASTILSTVSGVKVDLTSPQTTFLTAVSDKICLVGQLLAVKPKKFFAQRKAGVRPFKIPSALQPKLARCLVNLAVNSKNSVVLDPFAGSGAVVTEAGLIGHEAVGVEVKTWIANGMWRNISFYSSELCHVVQGDATRLPFRKKFDSVATDPPYGRSTTLVGISFRDLMQRFFDSVKTVLNKRARIAVSVPKENYDQLVESCAGFKILEHYDLYVHKSLTRRVVVMVYE